MARDLNQCNFIGRLGGDPEVKSTSSGKAVANFSIAVGNKTSAGESTEWVRIIAFERLAEVVGTYLKKGSKVFVSGRMQTRKWQDSQGIERYTTEIIASDMQMLDGKQESQQAQAPQQYHQPSPQPQRHQQTAANGAYNGVQHATQYQPGLQQPAPQSMPFDDFGDDIPW